MTPRTTKGDTSDQGPGFHPRWNEAPEERGRWSACSGLGFPRCGIDPVGVIARSRDAVTVLTSCAAPLDGPPGLDPADAVALLDEGDPGCVPLVRLWIDEKGAVYGVEFGAPPNEGG